MCAQERELHLDNVAAPSGCMHKRSVHAKGNGVGVHATLNSLKQNPKHGAQALN